MDRHWECAWPAGEEGIARDQRLRQLRKLSLALIVRVKPTAQRGAPVDIASTRNHLTIFVASQCFCSYTNQVAITYDLAKQAETLEKRSLDFEDAVHVFAGPTFETEDLRKDYGEKRVVCFGMLRDRIVVVGYTPRGADRHVFSMRKANDREQARIAPLLGV